MLFAASWAPCMMSTPALAYSPDRGTGTPMTIAPAPALALLDELPELVVELELHAAAVMASAARMAIAAALTPTPFIVSVPSHQPPHMTGHDVRSSEARINALLHAVSLTVAYGVAYESQFHHGSFQRFMHMSPGEPFRRVRVPSLDGQADGLVPADRLGHLGRGVDGGDPVVEVVLPAPPDRLRQPGVPARLDHRVVELLVVLDEAAARRVGVGGRVDSRERHDALHLVRRGLAGGQLGGVAFQGGAHAVDLADVLNRVLLDDPPSPPVHDEPFRGKPLQALPHRRAAHFQPVSQVGLHQALVGTQLTADDGRAQALVHPVSQPGRRGGAPPRGICHRHYSP